MREAARLGIATALGIGARPAAALAGTSAGTPVKPAPSDAELIGGLVGLEQVVAYVYDRAIHSRETGPRTKLLARQLIAHERAHARALIAQLLALGGTPPPPPTSARAVQSALRRHHTNVDFAHRRSAAAWARLLRDAEDVLERNYHTALSELRHPGLLTLCAEIYASEAQHSALIGELLHPGDAKQAVPNAYINGD